jgi:hypothetical protein
VSRTGTRGALAQAAWSVWIALAGLALVAGLVSCGAATPPAAAPDRCSPLALVELEATYVANVVALCGGRLTNDECDALPERKALRTEFEAKRQAWATDPECMQ